MGYYTYYSIEVPEGSEGLIAEFRLEYKDAEYAFDNEGNCNEEVKWYDSIKDLKEFSLKHPNVLFILYGEGEESCDFWKCYIRNGGVQRTPGIIRYEEFDPNELE